MRQSVAVTGVLVGIHLAATSAEAQSWRFHYAEPPLASIRVTRGIRFATADTLPLAMDLYRPAKSSSRAPAIIFYAMYWPAEGPPPRVANDYVTSWARIAAANGIVGIVADIRAEPGTGNAHRPARALGDDFQRLTTHLTQHAAEYGIDRDRIALFAASGSVSAALPAVQDTAQTAIRAAVMYYGAADVSAFRVDLPILYVRAGLDSPRMNAEIVRLASLALTQNAPLVLRNHHTGYHAFEVANNDVATRHIIDETIEFVKRATAPEFQAVVREGHLQALAAGRTSTGDHRGAAEALAQLVQRRPADGRTRYAYATALAADRQYTSACAEFRRLTPRTFGAILPGSRSCVLAGAVDSTIAWLGTFRTAWLRSEYVSSLRTDSVFAPLWARPEFQALFRHSDSLATPRR